MTVRFTRPDFSEYVVHFTKDKPPISAKENPEENIKKIGKLNAKERLFSLLNDNRIFATRMPWTNKPAVCFTECTWSSLLDHANNYSRYGVGFKKNFLFLKGGGPAIYISPHLWEKQNKHVGDANEAFDSTLESFITPFCPPYATKAYKAKYWKGKFIDYTHEREWRVPQDLNFKISDVAFVIVASYEDMAKAPKDLKDAIGRNNWLIMDNYEKIEQLWPIHRISGSA